MKKEPNDEEFCCPEFVPAEAYDDFCPPNNCPERILTPSYPSPTSCLPKEELEELEEKIEAANRLLLNLALSGEQSEEARRSAFDKLVGQEVKVKLKEVKKENETEDTTVRSSQANKKRRCRIRVCRNKTGTPTLIEGKVILVGFDFVVIKGRKIEFILPYSQVCKLYPNKALKEEATEPELQDVDACLRRDLTIHFGETVSCSPKLIQIFYRLHLSIYLLLLIDRKIKITFVGNKQLTGEIKDVYQKSLTLCRKNKKVQEIDIDLIRFITVKR